ncbi:hypothetical protein EI94DRAFT_1799015 [Lactarius quietus]|nr:hypothetical protein EI94DRAFT_1799015 [Lactarius quietus]
MSFLKHMNGLWKGLAPRARKQSLSDRMLPQASSPSEARPTLVSEPTSTPPHLTFSPPSPTLQTPISFPCDDVDPSWPWITVSGTEAEDVPVRPAQSLYPDLSRTTSTEPFPELRKTSHVSLSENSGLSCMATMSPAMGTSGSIPDAATRLQDFRSLIVEMRASLLERDYETVADAGGRDEEDIERLLRMLEDVMRKVRGLAERDNGLGVPLIKIHPAP